MSKPTIALQLYTIRDFTAIDLQDTLLKVKEMGYSAVEMAGMYGLSTTELKTIFDNIGLTVFSAHVAYSEFEKDAKSTIATFKTLGCRHVSIPILQKTNLPSGEAWDTTKELLSKIALLCKEANMPLMYHNHAFEFEKLENGEYILDELFNKIPEIAAQLDTGWITAADECPIKYIKKYTSRCPIVHLKDTIKVGDGYEDRPVGKGTQDMPAITKTAAEAGAVCFVVELDKAIGLTSLEAAKQSIEYLKTLGY